MDAEEALRQVGGVGRRGDIIAASSRGELSAALREGRIIKVGHGRYALSTVSAQRRAAAEMSGVLSHTSAAQHWGWAVKSTPEAAWVTVPRKRKVAATTRATRNVCHADLADDVVVDGVTSQLRTVLDCARRLPFDEALAVADSALRAGDITKEELIAVAARLRGRGAPEARRVAEAADRRAANPFESVLRAIVLEYPELAVVPQSPVQTIGLTYHPDLVDEGHRLVIEAESWSWHADQQTHSRDCVRFTLLTAAGWLVLRFTWEQVMHSPAYVRSVLSEIVACLDVDRRTA